MQAQKLLLFALIAGLLILQLSPPALARSGSTSESSDTNEDTNGDNGDAGVCIVSVLNFVIGQLNTLIPAIGLGFAACELPCSPTGTTGACIACIINAIPTIPMVPTNLDGCS